MTRINGCLKNAFFWSSNKETELKTRNDAHGAALHTHIGGCNSLLTSPPSANIVFVLSSSHHRPDIACINFRLGVKCRKILLYILKKCIIRKYKWTL